MLSRWVISLIFLSLLGCCAPAGPLAPLPKTLKSKLGRAEGSVTWYTPLRRETAEKIILDFQRRFQVRVEPTYGTDAELRKKLLSGSEQRPDVYQSTDPGVFTELEELGLIRLAEVPNRYFVSPWLTGSDASWVAPYVVTAVMAYRTDKGSIGKVLRWQNLRDIRFRSRLIVPDPSLGGPAFYWAVSLARLYGWRYVEAIGKNAILVSYEEATTRLITKNAILSGGLSGEDVWRAKRDNLPVTLIIPEEGILAIPAGVALLNGSSYPNAGLLFLNYLLSKDAQRIFVEDGFYAARTDMEPPTGRVPLGRLRMLQISWKKTALLSGSLKKRLGHLFRVPSRPATNNLELQNLMVKEGSVGLESRRRVKKEVSFSRFNPCSWFGRNVVENTFQISPHPG